MSGAPPPLPSHGTVPYLLKVTATWCVVWYNDTNITGGPAAYLFRVDGWNMWETNSNNRRNRWLGSTFVRKRMGNSRPEKGCCVRVWLTVLPCRWKKQISPKHWSIRCHNTGHCNINSYHTDNLKSHTYPLQSEVSATVAKHIAQSNAHNVHCRSVRW